MIGTVIHNLTQMRRVPVYDIYLSTNGYEFEVVSDKGYIFSKFLTYLFIISVQHSTVCYIRISMQAAVTL